MKVTIKNNKQKKMKIIIIINKMNLKLIYLLTNNNKLIINSHKWLLITKCKAN